MFPFDGPVFSISNYTTLLVPDGTGFDAQQFRNVEYVETDTGDSLYYSGLGIGNRMDLGLATSADGDSFVPYSQNQLLTEEPSFASFRFIPVTVTYENGHFRMWFYGNDRNSEDDPGRTRGIGYATSEDGIEWDFDYPVIRAETGARQGYSLLEMVELNGTFFGYGYEQNGPSTADFRFFVMTSDDGVSFDTEQAVAMSADGFIYAATEYEGMVLSLWKLGFNDDSGDYAVMTSENGIDFEFQAYLDLPNGSNVTTLHVVGETVEIWGNTVEIISTSYGTFAGRPAVRFEVDLELFGVLDDPVIFDGGKGSDSIQGGSNDDVLHGGKGADVMDGGRGDDILAGGAGADTILGGDGDDFVTGGKGADVLDGGEGNDILSGGKGADTVTGGNGDDILTGGEGPDQFVFTMGSQSGTDAILDFKVGDDQIVLSGVAPQDAVVLNTSQGAVVVAGYSGGDSLSADSYDLAVLLDGVDAQSLTTDDIIFV